MKKLIRPLIAIILLGLLFKSGFIKFDQLKESVQNTQLMLSGLGLIGFQFLFFTFRWKIIVDFYQKISFSKILKLSLIGQFFNIFIPGGVGGDVVKALELAKSEPVQKKNALTTVLIDRVMGLYCMIIFSTLFLFLELNQTFDVKKYFYTSLVMWITATLGFVFLDKISLFISTLTQKNNLSTHKKISVLIFIKISEALQIINAGFKSLSNFKTLTQIFIISLVAQLLSISFLYLVASSISSQTPSFILFFPLACFAFMASSIPITPGGIGFGQAAFYFIFSIFSKDAANAVVVGISLMQLFSLIFSLPGAYFFTKISQVNHGLSTKQNLNERST